MSVHFGHKLKNLIESKEITNREIAKRLNITEGNLYKIFNKEHLKTDIICQVCMILNITINEFFYEGTKENAPGSISGNGHIFQYGEGDKTVTKSDIKQCEIEIEYLKKLLEMKDQVISEKVEVNELLKKRLEEKA